MIIAGVVAVILGSVTVHGQAQVNVVLPFIYCLAGQMFRKTTFTSNVSALSSEAILRFPLVSVLVMFPTGWVSKNTKYGVTSVILVSAISTSGGVPAIVPVRMR